MCRAQLKLHIGAAGFVGIALIDVAGGGDEVDVGGVVIGDGNLMAGVCRNATPRGVAGGVGKAGCFGKRNDEGFFRLGVGVLDGVEPELGGIIPRRNRQDVVLIGRRRDSPDGDVGFDAAGAAAAGNRHIERNAAARRVIDEIYGYIDIAVALGHSGGSFGGNGGEGDRIVVGGNGERVGVAP